MASLKPDVLAVQEVEPLDKVDFLSGDCQPTYRHRDSLRSIRKAIGMFSYTGTKLESTCVMLGVRCYTAQQKNFVFHVMAAWTSKSPTSKGHYRQLHEALEQEDAWIRQRPTVVLGDFNQNATYRGRLWKTLLKLTDSLGLVSAYHEFSKERPGEEKKWTYYHKSESDRGFHIDYCFIPKEWSRHITSVKVGEYDEWKGISDHVPLIVDLDLPMV